MQPAVALHADHLSVELFMQERQTLTDAQDMLRKLGYTGNLLEASGPHRESQAPALSPTIPDSVPGQN